MDADIQKAKKLAIAHKEKRTKKPAEKLRERASSITTAKESTPGAGKGTNSSTSSTSTRREQKRATTTPSARPVEESDEDDEPNANVVLEQRPIVSKDFEGFGSEDNEDDGEDDDIVEDDQTAALLQGFESSEDDGDDVANAEDSNAITTIPTLPSSTALRTRLDGAAASASADASAPGVVYVGRVPHGFYEHQMRAYFSQFGDISRLRLSRNRRTGASKHYAFLEFASGEVARIVADTMDNYLMFGHLLKVKLVPRDKVHAELFKGAGRRFKAVPWNRIEKARLEKVDRVAWERKVERERRRRSAKAEKLRAAGLEYQPVGLREVGDVPVQRAVEGQADEVQQIEDAPEATTTQPKTQDVEAPGEDKPIEKSDQAMALSGAADQEPTKKVTLGRSTRKEKTAKA